MADGRAIGDNLPRSAERILSTELLLDEYPALRRVDKIHLGSRVDERVADIRSQLGHGQPDASLRIANRLCALRRPPFSKCPNSKFRGVGGKGVTALSAGTLRARTRNALPSRVMALRRRRFHAHG
ncbi:hypothetical protein NUW54_g13596 [Trametes sanguinea]|uniref:Uncharacterized protein n=1 Tax=Trametes sanguinea TaxID=158606 RepID=A0ACC1MLN6_9APHY|nr:hypothetical protein NUW54_g13596 [Trametes sanguinea]